MPVPIPCPNCKKPIGLSRTTLGKKIKCPSCGRSFVAGDGTDEPAEFITSELPPAAPTPPAAPVRRTKMAATPPVRKQGALRFLVFVLGLAGAAGAGLLASQMLATIRPDLAHLAVDFEPLNPYLQDASLSTETAHVRMMSAYLLAGAAILGLLGAVLALGGPGLVPMLFFLVALAAPLILNHRALPFTIAFVVAGVMSTALRAPKGRRSPVRLLLQMGGGVLAGAMLMSAGMTKFQPPGAAPPIVQPGNGEKPPTPALTMTPEQVREAPPDFVFTAQELYAEYDKDPAATHQKYFGKVLELSGVVEGCESHAGDSTLVFEVKKEPPHDSVSCVMQEKECWARHAHGQKVKVKGVWSRIDRPSKAKRGVDIASNPAFRNGPCLAHTIVLESDPNPAPLYLAEQLAMQFESNAPGLYTRYHDVIVEGEVLKVEKAAQIQGAVAVELRGTTRTPVRCLFDEDLQPEPKSGDKVRVIGTLSEMFSVEFPRSAAHVGLHSCFLVTVPTTAQPPTPLPGPYDKTIKDAAIAAAVIDKAGADVKLVPLEVIVGGVAMTMMAPEGATTTKKMASEVEVRAGPRFVLILKPGRSSQAAAEKYWLADRSEPTAAFVILLDDASLRNIYVKREARWTLDSTFLSVRRLGHADVRMTDGVEPFTQDDCLLMLRCARTLALKTGYEPPKDLDALKGCGVTATRDGGKLTIRTDANFTDAAMPYLVQFAADAEELTMASPLTDQALELLAGFPKLRRLEFSGASGDPFGVDGNGLKGVKDLKALEHLAINRAMLSDSSLLNLRPLSTLKSLNLDDTPISGSGFRLLRGLRIQTLSLNSTRADDAGLKNVGAIATLESLRLDHTRGTDAGLANLSGLKKLKELSLVGMPLTDAGMDHLKGLPELTTLNLEKTAIGDAGIDHLRNIKTLRTLGLMGSKVTPAKIVELGKAGITVK